MPRSQYEGKPGWFSLIASAAAPQSLLPFRYIDGIYLEAEARPRLGGARGPSRVWVKRSRPCHAANMRETPDGFPSSRVRLRRSRCSHSGISMGFIKRLKPGHDWVELRTKVRLRHSRCSHSGISMGFI